MDDKMFEERLSGLKQAYEEMPDRLNAQEITRGIIGKEGKKRRFRYMSLPAAASFAGVVLIGGLLSFQMMKHPESSPGEGKPGIMQQEQHPPAKEQIKEKAEEAKAYYSNLLEVLKKKLNNEDAGLYPFVQEANEAIAKFENQPFANEKELDTQSEKLKEKIESHVSTIDEQMAGLQKKAEKGETVSDEELLLLLSKQDQMYERYNEKWEVISGQATADMENFESAIASMNDGTYGNKELQPIVTEIRKAGYRFFDAGEGMINIQPDYTWPKKMLGGRISASFSDWSDLSLNSPFLADNSVKSYPDLAERLVELEEFTLKNPNFGRMEEVKMVYRNLLQNYILKGFFDPNIKSPSPEFTASIEKMRQNASESETYKSIAPLYQKYKEGTLQKGEKVKISSALQTSIPENVSPAYLLPLTAQMKDQYGELKASKDGQASISEGPYLGSMSSQQAVALRMYFYAVLNKDYDIAYILTDQKKSKAEFIQEAEKAEPEYKSLNHKVRYISTESSQSEEGLTIIELYSSEGKEKTFSIKDNQLILRQ
ncbi:hypothetical protein CEF21_18980 [Bacillus sp. FJAT-42376]|uniref:hypothetical protein n=1 Tax=Bacillus sp. FJAT-42376 TaxID=2014076 RepID=UPI000F4D6065|nr:hypothetical protein [Bacillus sp. FJAT-42376]AZB44208.1 hypothetical protein CEF21_18980 [Bacillus sp. FJAT-42376]